MAIKTPLREIRDAVVCAIAPDTYQVYQTDIHITSRANFLEVLHVTNLRMRARIIENHADCLHLSPSHMVSRFTSCLLSFRVLVD